VNKKMGSSRGNFFFSLLLTCFFIMLSTMDLSFAEEQPPVPAPEMGLTISVETMSGDLSLGNLDAIGLNEGYSDNVDKILLIDLNNHLKEREARTNVSGALYIIGSAINRSAIKITSTLPEGMQGELSFSNQGGDLDLYISNSTTSWHPGMSLNSNYFREIPVDNSEVPLRGVNGFISSRPVKDQDEVMLDLAAKVPMDEDTGLKLNNFTFTLLTF
jgi:hypothetical protein